MRSLRELLKFKVHANDEVFGKISDFYFDDQDWHVRYLVVDTGGWLSGRSVLLSPTVAGVPNWLEQSIPVALSREQIENSPPISSDKPVSRQHEEALSLYYGWPRYWTLDGAPLPSLAGLPVDTMEPLLESSPAEPPNEGDASAGEQAHANPHLRSLKEVVGYLIAASDGEIGHVEDFLADLDTWRIEKLVVDTRNWLPGKDVVLGIDRVAEVSWEERCVTVSLTKAKIEGSPELGRGSTFF
ncbi:MAG: PRC-barrel domain-containing protein [Bryobacterales bacterium]|nr:PRC-barrel domain-containing protein [Bryobacterales bacterium]